MFDKSKLELEQFKQIWLTKKSYKILRAEKIKQKKSMARIIDNLILKKYD